MMISASNLASLLEILEDTEQSLDNTTKSFYKAFPKPDRFLKLFLIDFTRFKTACTMCMMIREELIGCEARLCALFVLYDLYKVDSLSSNPFFPLFLAILQDTEQVACSCLVSYFFDAQAQQEVGRTFSFLIFQLRKLSVKKILSSMKTSPLPPTISGLPSAKRPSPDVLQPSGCIFIF